VVVVEEDILLSSPVRSGERPDSRPASNTPQSPPPPHLYRSIIHNHTLTLGATYDIRVTSELIQCHNIMKQTHISIRKIGLSCSCYCAVTHFLLYRLTFHSFPTIFIV
jgi:hypothetical protein